MLAKKYKSELISVTNPFKDIYTLEFRSLNSRYRYSPGQFLHLAIDEDYDGSGQWPESRCFSMQSNPNDETIKITYSVKGGFTARMQKQLKVGSELWLKLPYGELFTQPHNKTNTIFIAGGTGITPFLSLFTHETFNEYTEPKIYLGFRSKKFNIYDEELLRLCNSCRTIQIYYEEIGGPLDINHICSVEGINSCYFISGPPAMIRKFRCVLVSKGIPLNQILTDEWE